MIDLIVEFGKLRKADWKFDAKIHLNLFCTPTPKGYKSPLFSEVVDRNRYPWLLPDGTPTNADMVSAPPYTASIDAASKLVPEGLAWKLHVTTQGALAHILPDNEYYVGPALAFCEGKTGALALCLAALRARELA